MAYGQGSITQLPSGSWRWQGSVNGERVSITGKTREEAGEEGRLAQASSQKPDPEARAVALIVKALAPLDEEARARVARWMAERYA